MSRAERDAAVRSLIEAFLASYNVAHSRSYRVLQWLDDVSIHGRKAECLAGDKGPQLAIEHTLLQPFDNQKRDDVWFQEMFEPLRLVVGPHLSVRLYITVLLDALRPEHPRKEIRARLLEWLIRELPSVPEGESVQHVSGVPFDVYIRKESDRPPGLFPGRFAPDDGARVSDATRALTWKEPVLRLYKERGLRTALLLECGNISLDNLSSATRDVQQAIANGATCGSADDIWLVDNDGFGPPLFQWVRSGGRTSSLHVNV